MQIHAHSRRDIYATEVRLDRHWTVCQRGRGRLVRPKVKRHQRPSAPRTLERVPDSFKVRCAAQSQAAPMSFGAAQPRKSAGPKVRCVAQSQAAPTAIGAAYGRSDYRTMTKYQKNIFFKKKPEKYRKIPKKKEPN